MDSWSKSSGTNSLVLNHHSCLGERVQLFAAGFSLWRGWGKAFHPWQGGSCRRLQYPKLCPPVPRAGTQPSNCRFLCCVWPQPPAEEWHTHACFKAQQRLPPWCPVQGLCSRFHLQGWGPAPQGRVAVAGDVRRFSGPEQTGIFLYILWKHWLKEVIRTWIRWKQFLFSVSQRCCLL